MTKIAHDLEHRYARRIGSRLRELREARRWTQGQLAERLDVYLREVRRWESGEQLPPLRRLLQLAETLGVEPADLLGRGADPGGGLAARLLAARKRCGPDTRQAVAALLDTVLALLALDEEAMGALVGAVEVIEGSARVRESAAPRPGLPVPRNPRTPR